MTVESHARNTVVSVRLDDLAILAVDLLVQAGLAQSRSEAVAQFVAIGIRSAEELLTQARELADRVQKARQEMLAAVKSRDVSRVRELLDQDATLVNAAEGETTALLTSVYWGARDVTALLLSRGVQLNLFEAAAVGAVDRLRDLLKAEPELIHTYSHDGWTALHLASFFGHPVAAALLLGYGADANAVGKNAMANQPLHAALASGRSEVAQLLLSHGTEVDRGDGSGWTPLHLAAANGNQAMVAELIRRGAGLGAQNKDGVTPLALAVEKGHGSVAALLRENGAE